MRQGETYSLIVLKSKNEVKKKKKIIFTLYRTITVFAHFWKIKMNIKQIFVLSNFLFVDCSLMFKEGVHKFSKKY